MPHTIKDKLPRVDIASVPDDLREHIWNQLDAYFPGADRGRVDQLSALPPAWVEILADLTSWTAPFMVAAAAYAAQLAKHLADDHWERREEIRKKVLELCGDSVARVREFFLVFRSAQEELGRPLGVIAAIPGRGGEKTVVTLTADDEAEFVEQVCLFVANLAGVRAAAEQLGSDGVGGDVWCVLSADGFRLEWMDEPTPKKYEQDFKLDGTPLGERRPWVRRERIHSG